MTKRRAQGSPESSKAKALSKLRKLPLVNRWLPEELRLHILARMPLPEILKSTLLCKEWKASVQSESLARLSTEDQREACLLFYSKHKQLMMKCPELPKLAVLAKPHAPSAYYGGCHPSSSKGVLCYLGVLGFVVCNPVVGYYRLLKPVEHWKKTLKTVKLVVDVEMKCSFRVGVSYYDDRFPLELKSRVYDSESNEWNGVIPVPEPDFVRQGLTLTKEVLQGSLPLVLFAATGCDHDLYKCWLPLNKVPCPCPDGGQKLLDMRLVVYKEQQKSWSTYNLPSLQTSRLLFVKGFVDNGRCILATVSMAGIAGISRRFSVLELDHAGKKWKLVSSLDLNLKCCRCSEVWEVCRVCRMYRAAGATAVFDRESLFMILHSGSQIKILAAGDTVVIHCKDWGTAALDMAKLSWTLLEQVPFAVFTPTLARLSPKFMLDGCSSHSSGSDCALFSSCPGRPIW